MEIEWEPNRADNARGAPSDGSGLQPGLATFRAVELAGRTYDIEMMLVADADGLIPTSVRVSSRDGSAVTGTELRAVRVRELVQHAYVHSAGNSVARPAINMTGSSTLSVRATSFPARYLLKTEAGTVPGDPVSRFRNGRWLTVDGDGRMVPDDLAKVCRFQGPTPETLGWVALIYGSAKELGLPPARQVEKDLGLPRTTASKWVRRARQQGFIQQKGDGDG